MKRITKEEVLSQKYSLTVGDIKKHILKYNLPDDTKVLVQRVEDYYYDNNNWGQYLKEGENYRQLIEWNEKITSGKFLDKEQYPNIKPEELKICSDEQLEDSMDKYHPVHCCMRYNDDPEILFLDMHY